MKRAPALTSLVGLLTLLAALAWAGLCAAHAAPHSFVLLDFRSSDVEAELRLPVPELETALRRPLRAEHAQVVDRAAPAIRDYVAQYVHAESLDHAPWSVAVEGLGYRVDDDVAFVVVHARLTPPPGESAQVFTLDYDVISHEVVNHTAWVAVRSDFAHGVVGGAPSVIGVIRYLRKSLLVDRTGGGASRGFFGTVHLGIQHIAEGTDHLLFLLVLLLPAPLLVARTGKGRRAWGEHAGVRASFAKLVRIVTAFTVGHSLTLLLGSMGWVRLPSAPVETLIAVSILVSAVHAIRPLFPGREAWVSGGFGLVHGLAFASALAELHLDAARLALAVLGFNLGIEAMQLAVVAVSFPWLVLLARTRAYAPVRIAGATFAGIAATAWVAERALGLSNPVGQVVNAIAAHPFALLALLAGGSLVAYFASVRPAAARRVAAGAPLTQR